MTNPGICPEHGKHIVAECSKCGKLLCRECLKRSEGKYLCKVCAGDLEDGSEKKGGESRLWLISIFVFSTLLFVVGVYLFASNIIPVVTENFSKSLTTSKLTRVSDALQSLKEDIGRYPTEEEGLLLLLNDRTGEDEGAVDDWYGPYLPLGDETVLDDNFGNPIYYGFMDGEPYIQSFGENEKQDAVPQKVGEKPGGDDIVIWLSEGEEEIEEEIEEEDLEFGKPVVKGGWW